MWQAVLNGKLIEQILKEQKKKLRQQKVVSDIKSQVILFCFYYRICKIEKLNEKFQKKWEAYF